MKKHVTLLALALVLIASPDCKKKTKVVEPTPTPTPVAEPATKPTKSRDLSKFKTAKVTKERIQLEEGKVVLFETNSDKLLPESNMILDEIAGIMSEETSIKIRVEGHTDDVGDDKKNLDLSKRRAASVKAYLESKGIAADRVSSDGCGEKSFITDNKTDEGKQKNRRVEFVILKDGTEQVCKLYQTAQ
jgi:outer membrane protein OmpA-like peptidoglycan-associated protein